MDLGFQARSDPVPPSAAAKRPLEDATTPAPAKKKVSFSATPEGNEKTPGPAAPPTTATKYKDRQNGGSVVDVVNKHLARRDAWASVDTGRSRAAVEASPSAADVQRWTEGRAYDGDAPAGGAVGADKPYRHMFTPPGERCAALDASLATLATEVRRAEASKGAAAAEPIAVGSVTPNPGLFVGRVCLDALEGRLNKASVVLEGERADGAFRVPLDVSAVEGSYALFPGQVVAVKGSAPHEDGSVVARSIEGGAPAPAPTTSRKELRKFSAAQGGKPLSVWVAAGPYTTNDDLDYAPLNDLLAAAKGAKPDVVVLLGPFVDAEHPAVKKNELNEGGEPVDAATLFVLKVAWQLEKLLDEDPEGATRFVLAPATRDVVGAPVYPQPPLGVAAGGDRPSWQDEFPMGSLELPTASGRVHCVGNPGLFKVNECVVGVTATDVLFQLSSQELFVNGRDGSALASLPRVARLASHLLAQRSFYPLFPPPAMQAVEAPVDLRQQAKWRLPVRPDLLIAPSKLQPFARDVGGCLVINPGHLARGAAGGTFAQLAVHPLPDDAAASEETRVAHDVPGRARVEITRI